MRGFCHTAGVCVTPCRGGARASRHAGSLGGVTRAVARVGGDSGAEAGDDVERQAAHRRDEGEALAAERRKVARGEREAEGARKEGERAGRQQQK